METKIIAGALRIAADDMIADYDVVGQCLREAADRLESLHVALHDAVNMPKGAAPDSAEGLYSPSFKPW